MKLILFSNSYLAFTINSFFSSIYISSRYFLSPETSVATIFKLDKSEGPPCNSKPSSQPGDITMAGGSALKSTKTSKSKRLDLKWNYLF